MQKDFQNFIDTLKNSIKDWDYFVNWEKVFKNKAKYEITLNKLNYLLGKEDLEKEFLEDSLLNLRDLIAAAPNEKNMKRLH